MGVLAAPALEKGYALFILDWLYISLRAVQD